MSLLSDLAFRWFGHDFGTWYWVPNDKSANAFTGEPWSTKVGGSHPFVIVVDYLGGPAVTVRGRSTSQQQGLAHKAHPPACALNCRINENGWIKGFLYTLQVAALTAEAYSCGEPYEDILARLRQGDL